MEIQVLFYFAIFGYALPNVSYLQNFRFQFLIIRKLDPFFTKSVDFKHVSMATEESGNTSFVLFCYFWLRFTKCVIPATFQIPVPHNKEVIPFFTKSVDFKHVSMATEESENMCFVLFCYFWLGFTKCVIPAKFQIPVPHNNRVRPIFYQICGF